MWRSLMAGVAYGTAALAIGIVLGVPRTLVLEPALGAPWAVVLELPVILAATWLLCRRLVGVSSVPRTVSARAVMGGVALVCLLAGEVVLFQQLSGRPPGDFLDALATLQGGLGLAGQVLFASWPLLQLAIPAPARNLPKENRAQG